MYLIVLISEQEDFLSGEIHFTFDRNILQKMFPSLVNPDASKNILSPLQ